MGFWNGASTLKQYFVLPKNGSKYYLKYTFLAFPVLGILGLGTPLLYTLCTLYTLYTLCTLYTLYTLCTLYTLYTPYLHLIVDVGPHKSAHACACTLYSLYPGTRGIKQPSYIVRGHSMVLDIENSRSETIRDYCTVH